MHHGSVETPPLDLFPPPSAHLSHRGRDQQLAWSAHLKGAAASVPCEQRRPLPHAPALFRFHQALLCQAGQGQAGRGVLGCQLAVPHRRARDAQPGDVVTGLALQRQIRKAAANQRTKLERAPCVGCERGGEAGWSETGEGELCAWGFRAGRVCVCVHRVGMCRGVTTPAQISAAYRCRP